MSFSSRALVSSSSRMDWFSSTVFPTDSHWDLLYAVISMWANTSVEIEQTEIRWGCWQHNFHVFGTSSPSGAIHRSVTWCEWVTAHQLSVRVRLRLHDYASTSIRRPFENRLADNHRSAWRNTGRWPASRSHADLFIYIGLGAAVGIVLRS